MKGSALVATLVLMMGAAPVFAQQQPPAGQARPAQPAQQPPATAQPPAPVTQPPPQPPAPFPAGAKIAFFNPQAVFQQSAEGKAALTRVNALTQKKQNENAERQKKLQADQQKLQTSGSMLNDTARGQLEKDIEKQQVEMQRFQQDAQAEIQELQQEVQNDFIKKLQPIVDKLANEKGLHLVFNAAEAGLAWAAPGLDLTSDVIKALDAANKPAASPKP